MLKKQKQDITKEAAGIGFEAEDRRAIQINAATVFETYTEQLSPFGWLIGSIKF